MKIQFSVLGLAFLMFACTSTPETPSTSNQPQQLESFFTHPVPYANVRERNPAGTAGSLFGVNMDGCYQMYMPGSMYPSFCIQGSMEEGIGGGGTKVIIFSTNTNIIIGCMNASKSGVSEANEYFVEAGGKREMTLKNVKVDKGMAVEGDALFGKTQLKFVSVSAEGRQNLMKAYSSHKGCQNVAPGEVKAFNRGPSSDIKVLSDTYGDARVYFCSNNQASVVINPNKCGQNRAKGQNFCTELPTSFERSLKVIEKGGNLDLLTTNGKAAYSLKKSGAGFLMQEYGNEKYELAWKTLDAQELQALKFMGICQ